MRYLSLTLPGGQTIEPPAGLPSGGFESSTGMGNSIVGWALMLAFTIGVIVTLFMIVYAGIQWITSGGDKEKLANARKRMIYSIIGLVVIILSLFFVNMLLNFFGTTPLPTG